MENQLDEKGLRLLTLDTLTIIIWLNYILAKASGKANNVYTLPIN
jgi:hypothetical protein